MHAAFGLVPLMTDTCAVIDPKRLLSSRLYKRLNVSSRVTISGLSLLLFLAGMSRCRALTTKLKHIRLLLRKEVYCLFNNNWV